MPDSWLEEIDEFRSAREEIVRSLVSSLRSKAQGKLYRGLIYYPPDPRFKVKGSFDHYATPIRTELETSKGGSEQWLLIGRINFSLNGKDITLNAYRSESTTGKSVFVPFKDSTSGVKTSETGRYLKIETGEGGRVILDFNYSCNPDCVYNPTLSSPIPPPENSIPVAIEAGEIGPDFAPDE
ncbi:MAG: DUF1684 domain-containing protein [Nitrososphaerota archaeon]|nr:DUF1684 domain-containing protein [Nitrososphaerota archaeon]